MKEFFVQYADNKLLLAIAAGLVGAILTKLVPFIYNSLRSFVFWIGRLIGGRFAFKDFRKQYLDWVVTENRDLKLTGIVISDEAKKPSLEQVYVSLRVGQKENHSTTQDPSTELLKFNEEIYNWKEIREIIRFICSKNKGHYSVKKLRNQSLRIFWDELLSNYTLKLKNVLRLKYDYQIIKNKDIDKRKNWIRENKNLFKDILGEFHLRYILRKHDKAAILGVPGAGKTTLLQFIALTYARERASDPKLHQRGLVKKRFGSKNWRLPIFIRLSSVPGLLAGFSERDRDTSIIDVLHRIIAPDLQSSKVAFKFFSYYIKKGKCIILLDGLDEVPSNSEFIAVTRAINSLCISYPGNQFIITSRIAGWRGGVNSDFETFYVNDLTDVQVNNFIDIWYAAVERNMVIGRLKDEGHSERKARERRAMRQSKDLKTTLTHNIGIRRLATNPMLLSIIAVVHRSLATLPKERSKLYAQCSKILLEQWDISRGVRVDDTNLKLEQKEAIIRRIAIALHTGEIGTKGGSREANKIEVQRIIEQVLPNLGRPAQDASYLLQMLIDRSGIIVERQREKLAFAHHTFQEYFSAQYLTLVDPDKNREFLLQAENLLSDWWREVILLYAGHQADSSSFIRFIYQSTSDDLFQTRLRLAALCLNEAIEVKDIKLRRKIIADVLNVKTGTVSDNGTEILSIEISDYIIKWSKSEKWNSYAAISKVKSCIDGVQMKSSYGSLLLLLGDKQLAIRKAAIQALIHVPSPFFCEELIGKVVTMLKEASDSETEMLSELLVVIAQSGKSKKVITELLKAIAENNSKDANNLLNPLEFLKKSIEISDIDIHYLENILKCTNKKILDKVIPILPFAMCCASPEQMQAFFKNISNIEPDTYTQILRLLKPISTSVAETITCRVKEILDIPQIDVKVLVGICYADEKIFTNESLTSKIYNILEMRTFQKELKAPYLLAKLFSNLDPEIASEKIISLLISDNIKKQFLGLKILPNISNLKTCEIIPKCLFNFLEVKNKSIRIAAIEALSILAYTEYKQVAFQKLLNLVNAGRSEVAIAALRTMVAFEKDSISQEGINSIIISFNKGSMRRRIAACDLLLKTVQTINDPTLTNLLWQSLHKSIYQKKPLFSGHEKHYHYLLKLKYLLAYLGRYLYPEKTLDLLFESFDPPLLLFLSSNDTSFADDFFSDNFKKIIAAPLEVSLQTDIDHDNHLLTILSTHLPEHVIIEKIITVFNEKYLESKISALYAIYILRDKINISQFESPILAVLEDKEGLDYLNFNGCIKIALLIYTRTKSKKIADTLKKLLSYDDLEIQENTWHILQKINSV